MPRRRKWSDEQLRRAASSSISIRQTLLSIGLRAAGGNYESIKRRVADLGIDTRHWLGEAWLRGRKNVHVPTRPLESILQAGVRYNTSDLRQRLIKAGILQARCAMCGQSEWQGAPIALELDHIDGDRENNLLINLRLLCPNCHATTPTYRGRNTRYPHIPPLKEILAGIERAGSVAKYAETLGVSKAAVRWWLQSRRLRNLSEVKECLSLYEMN